MSYRFLFFHVSFFLLAEKNAILFTLRTFYRKHVVKYFVRKAMRFVLRKHLENVVHTISSYLRNPLDAVN